VTAAGEKERSGGGVRTCRFSRDSNSFGISQRGREGRKRLSYTVVWQRGRMTLFGVTVDYYHTGGSGSDATPPQKRQFD